MSNSRLPGLRGGLFGFRGLNNNIRPGVSTGARVDENPQNGAWRADPRHSHIMRRIERREMYNRVLNPSPAVNETEYGPQERDNEEVPVDDDTNGEDEVDEEPVVEETNGEHMVGDNQVIGELSAAPYRPTSAADEGI